MLDMIYETGRKQRKMVGSRVERSCNKEAAAVRCTSVWARRQVYEHEYLAEVDAGERADRGRQLPDEARELAREAEARAVVVQHQDLARLGQRRRRLRRHLRIKRPTSGEASRCTHHLQMWRTLVCIEGHGRSTRAN